MIPNGWEFVILVVLLFVLFGATKLPSAARSIGQSMRIFKAETKGLRSEDAGPSAQPPAPQPPAQQVLPPANPQTATPSEQYQRHNDAGR